MNKLLSLLIITISALILTSCSTEEPQLTTCGNFTIECELDKDYVLVRVDSLSDEAPDMFLLDAFGRPVTTEHGRNWYVIVSKTQQLVPMEMFQPDTDLLKSLLLASNWIKDGGDDGKPYRWYLGSMGPEIQWTRYPNSACHDCNVKVILTGPGQTNITALYKFMITGYNP